MAGNPSDAVDEGHNLKASTHSTFEDVLNSDSFVDKTMLIHVLFGRNDCPKVMITAPRRFGKSVNLNMLLRFLELEVDKNGVEKIEDQRKNYKLFTEVKALKIMKCNMLVKKHFGKYPIIMVNFCTSDLVRSEEAALIACKKAIHYAYKKHKYLYENDKSPLSESEKLECKKWCTYPDYEDFQRHHVVTALRDLSEYLREFFQRRVFVLVDEFDSIIASALFKIKDKDIRKKTVTLPIAIISAVVKNNDDNMSGALITGILDIKGMLISSTMGNLDRYRFGIHNLTMTYNGFLKDEIDVLFEKWKVDKELRDAAFVRYKYYDLSGKEIYNPYGIVKFLQALIEDTVCAANLENYWQKSGYVEGLKNLLHSDVIVELINNLLQKQTVNCTVTTDLTVESILDLTESSFSPDITETDIEEIAIIFLLCQGYLTLSPAGKGIPRDQPRPVVIPNSDIEHELRMIMINYFCKEHQLKRRLSKSCADSFSRLLSICKHGNLRESKCALQNFQETLNELFKSAKLVTPVNESTFQSLFSNVIIRKAGFLFANELEPLTDKRFRADVVAFNGNFGAAIELKCDQKNAERAMLQVFGKRYYAVFASKKYKFADKNPQLSLLLGIHFNSGARHFTISAIRRQELIDVVNELKVGDSNQKLEKRIELTLEGWDGKTGNDPKIKKFLDRCVDLP